MGTRARLKMTATFAFSLFANRRYKPAIIAANILAFSEQRYAVDCANGRYPVVNGCIVCNCGRAARSFSSACSQVLGTPEGLRFRGDNARTAQWQFVPALPAPNRDVDKIGFNRTAQRPEVSRDMIKSRTDCMINCHFYRSARAKS
jgi:hypothetical protein